MIYDNISGYNANYDPNKKGAGLNFAHKVFDADEFQAVGREFKEFGRYTSYPENSHPNSRYMKFWKEQKRRSIEGYNIGRDWIPGYAYFYLNFSPIPIVVEDNIGTSLGNKKRARREYTLPHFWDYDYYYFHYLEEAEKYGKHASVLKSRGQGYSNKGASMLARNYFLIKNSLSYAVAHDKKFLTGQDGLMHKFKGMKEFINKNTAFFKHSHKINKIDHIRASKVVKSAGRELEDGYMSEVASLSVRNNPNKIRGVRGKLILWEEAGEFPELIKAWNIALESVQRNDLTFGLMVAFGTGGSEIKSFRTLNELFRKPKAYFIHSVPDIWSKKATSKETGFFVPSYANREGSMDENGNTDIEDAYNKEAAIIENMEAEGASQESINQKKAERPKHPEEALLMKEGSNFPTSKINDRIYDLEGDNIAKSNRMVGSFHIKEGKVVFRESNNKVPIENYPLDPKDSKEGAVVIYEKPYSNKAGIIPHLMYIGGIDPYDQDQSTTDSLGSVFIMNRVTRVIVAEYTGRPRKASDYYEQVRLLLMYYNAIANYENNLVGVKTHFEKKGSIYLLAKDLQLYRKITKLSKVDREYGTPGTTPINNYAIGLIIEWLEDKIAKDEETEYVSTIESLPLLQEMRDYDSEGNFDRISAMGMLMLYEMELRGIEVKGASEMQKEEEMKKIDEDIWDELMYEDYSEL